MNVHAFGCSHVYGHEHTQFMFDNPHAELNRVTGDTVALDQNGVISNHAKMWNNYAKLWLPHLVASVDDYASASHTTSYATVFSKLIGAEQCYNYSERGSSNTQIYYTFLDHYDNIKDNDLVLIGVTGIMRQMQAYQDKCKSVMIGSNSQDTERYYELCEDTFSNFLKVHAMTVAIKSMCSNVVFVNIDWAEYNNIAQFIDTTNLHDRFDSISNSAHASTVNKLQEYFNNLFINKNLISELELEQPAKCFFNHYNIKSHNTFAEHIAAQYKGTQNV